MGKSLTEMAAEIVAAQAGHASMTPEEMREALERTFQALKHIKSVEEGAEAPVAKPALEPKDSIQRNKVICLECGKEFKQLTQKHLSTHGLTAAEYKSKYGFRARQPLSAKSLSAKRRRSAKALGLADKLAAARKARKKPAVVAEAVPAKKVIRRRKKA